VRTIGDIKKLVEKVVTIGACCALLALVIVPLACGQEPEQAPQTDEDYEKFLQENPGYKSQIEEIDALLGSDEELEESYLAYQESLSVNAELAQQESTFFEVLQEDTVLAERLARFEEIAAQDSEAIGQLTAMDSLLAEDQGLVKRMEEVELAAGEDPDLLENHGDQMAHLQTHPEEAEEFFALEEGPT
jgi:hypothetical protein